MQTDAQSLYAAAMRLPEGDRLDLASRLLESLPPDDVTMSLDDPKLVDELDRRAADTAAGVPWSELKAEG